MVHPKTGTSIVAALVGEIPVDALLWMNQAYCVETPRIKHGSIRPPTLRKIHSNPDPAPRHHSVYRRWHDIVVPAENSRLTLLEQKFTAGDQTLEPFQLVVEFRTRSGIAVGQVKAADDKPVDLGLDVACVSSGSPGNPRRRSSGSFPRVELGSLRHCRTSGRARSPRNPLSQLLRQGTSRQRFLTPEGK